MVDVNEELQRSLKDLSCALVYRQPDGFNALPVVSYYNITEAGSFAADNEELMQDGEVQLDIWANVPKECADIAAEINGLLANDGWIRDFSMDVPRNGGARVCHRTMKYTKTFYNN